MKLSEMIQSELNIESETQKAWAEGYARSRKLLEQIKQELEKSPSKPGQYEIKIELNELAGANGWPNQPYLKCYRPYTSWNLTITSNRWGGFRIGDGYDYTENSNLPDRSIEAGLLQIARSWKHL